MNYNKNNNEMSTVNLANSSVVSYPDRDNRFGNNKYRGNCSGLMIKDIINFFKPKLFVDACEGGKTSRDVCKALGINYVGLDLFNGNDFTKDSILAELPYEADVCFSHPPYHNMIEYSGSQWGKGNGNVEGDTSHCKSVDEFLAKSQVMLMNQRNATKGGGIYATLIADQKVKGVCHSYQADLIKMMPKSELLNVVIKMQHNTSSANKQYGNRNFIPIAHEYLMLWKKKHQSIYAIGMEIAKEAQKVVARTWRSVIRIVMMNFNGQVTLSNIYAEVEKVAQDLINGNDHWKAKIRQMLQRHHTFVVRGTWEL